MRQSVEIIRDPFTLCSSLQIIRETEHWIALNKPAGQSVEGLNLPFLTLEQAVRNHLPNGYLGIVHRIDRPTSGLVVMAKKKSAHRHLQQQFEKRMIRKDYLAVTEYPLPRKANTLQQWHRRSGDRKKALITDQPVKGSKEARLWFRQVAEANGQTLVQVRLFTGRYHQIRAQFAQMGCALLDDQLYGATKQSEDIAIGLHAWRLQLRDPADRSDITLAAPTPANQPWPGQWQDLITLD